LSASAFARSFALLAALAAAVSCAPPRVAPLQGAPVPAQQLPKGILPGGTRQVVFKWELRDGDVNARGDGVARIASPDSVRLDFFLGGGFQVPGPEAARRLVPPRALLWAALGRLDIPAEPDTVVRVDAGVLRADIGAPVRWRATFHGDTLTRLERVDGGRLQEWVERAADRSVQYRNEAARRTLSLVIQRSDAVPPFDPAIWRLY
jgi:hypothetical protein